MNKYTPTPYMQLFLQAVLWAVILAWLLGCQPSWERDTTAFRCPAGYTMGTVITHAGPAERHYEGGQYEEQVFTVVCERR